MNNIELIAELEPLQNKEKLEARLRALIPHFDVIDIPEAPLGNPSVSSALLAVYIWSKYGIKVIPHIKVTDVNSLALINIVNGLATIGIEEVVVLKGDPPRIGSTVEDVTVESVPDFVKKYSKNIPRLGALISLRYPRNLIERRLNKPFAFYYILRPIVDLDKLAWLSREARRNGKRLYAYIIVMSEKNKPILQSLLGDQPVYETKEAITIMERLSSLVDGFIVSSPGDVNAMISVAQHFQ